MSKAKAANMPKDKIDAAIKRGVEGKDGANAESVLYEASGPSGSALMVVLGSLAGVLEVLEAHTGY